MKIEIYQREKVMSDYYESKDLDNFPNIAEFAEEEGNKFFDYYEEATAGNELSDRVTALIGLSVAHVNKCPYCIDAFTNKCLSLGISKDEMMEAVHVGSAITAGAINAHSTQMLKILEDKEM